MGHQRTEEHHSQRYPQSNTSQADEYDRDLHKHSREGQNIGDYTVTGDPEAKSASQIKEIRNQMSDWTDETLREIPIVPVGRQLKEGAVYLDLHASAISPFTAHEGMVAREENWYVPKAETPYPIWNRLIGIENPERTP